MSHERRSSTEQLISGLGWFSIGLGLAEILAPGAVARLAGVPRTRSSTRTLQLMGVREVVTGVAILAKPGASAPVWGRVAGDVLDLALLGGSLSSPDAHKARLLSAVAAVLGVTAVDAFGARRAGTNGGASRPIEASATITIGRPIAEVYEFCSDIGNFPSFLRYVDSVVEVEPGRSHWRVQGPAGVPIEWESEIVSDQQNHLISWRSLPSSRVHHRGALRFEPAPGSRGTEVHAEIRYWPPAGELGHAVAWLFGRAPRQQLREGLKRIKQVLEVGEIQLSDGPGLSRPAQPVQSIDALNELVGVES